MTVEGRSPRPGPKIARNHNSHPATSAHRLRVGVRSGRCSRRSPSSARAAGGSIMQQLPRIAAGRRAIIHGDSRHWPSGYALARSAPTCIFMQRRSWDERPDLPHSARTAKLIATAMKAAWAAACAAAARSVGDTGRANRPERCNLLGLPRCPDADGWLGSPRRPACPSTGPRLRRYGQVSAQQGRAPLDRPLRAPINLKPIHHAFRGDGGQTTAIV